MKYKTLGFVFLTLFGGGLIFTNSLAASGSIKWYAYEEGLTRGQKEQKKIFLHFWAAWCDSCKKMAKETFTDSSVIAYLNKNFISIKVNFDKKRAIASEYNVRGIPDNWFLAEKNGAISNLPGYIPAKMLLPILKYIHSDNYKKMSFGKFMDQM